MSPAALSIRATSRALALHLSLFTFQQSRTLGFVSLVIFYWQIVFAAQ